LKRLIVAIDGPAGSGKSTVTHLLAKKLGYVHIDTGALYRCIAFKAIRNQMSLSDSVAMGKLAAESKLEFQWLGDERNHVFLDGQRVSDLIRTPEIGLAASKISAYPEVRKALLGLQRQLGENGGAVLEGRDVGTVVFPNADIKFFLTASVESRARRRMVELEDKGIYLDFEEVKRQVQERDKGDTERAVAPLKKAQDAVEVDTTAMTIEEVVANLHQRVIARANGVGASAGG
jgi:cytidylate kinase